MELRRILAHLAIALTFVGVTWDLHAAAIHDAVAAGDTQRVNALIAGDAAALNLRDESGKSPLMLAVQLGHAEIVAALVAAGADVNLSDNKNSSALHLAVERADTELMELLIRNGANLEATDDLQRTPLILAAEGEEIGVAEILIENGANINAVATRGYSALLWGARNQNEEFVDLLIAAGARLAPETLPRALELAVIGGLENLFRHTVELGCNIAEVKERDPGLIFPAAAGGSVAIVKTLVELGFDPVQSDQDGYTAVHAAAMEGRLEVLLYFHELGMDFNDRNLKGESAFNAAIAVGQTAAANCLAHCGADTGAPHYPLFKGPYMGQKPPGDTPQMFLPGIVSGHDRAHSALVFSPDAMEAYWTEMRPNGGAVLYSDGWGGAWTYPQVAAVDRDPMFSPDGRRLYYIKTRPYREGDVKGGDTDFKEEIWYLERTESGWSEPISAGDDVNAIGLHWPCSVDRLGNLYFSEFSDNMYVSQYAGGTYQKPQRLTEAFGNAALIGSCPFIGADGDYLLYVGHDSLKISFKRGDSTWTDGINLGGMINASHVNGSPRITPDGKYMFFVSAGQGRPWGIYWVSAEFIKRLRPQ